MSLFNNNKTNTSYEMDTSLLNTASTLLNYFRFFTTVSTLRMLCFPFIYYKNKHLTNKGLCINTYGSDSQPV